MIKQKTSKIHGREDGCLYCEVKPWDDSVKFSNDALSVTTCPYCGDYIVMSHKHLKISRGCCAESQFYIWSKSTFPGKNIRFNKNELHGVEGHEVWHISFI